MTAPLILKRASTSRCSGEWSGDDYDVLAILNAIGNLSGCSFGAALAAKAVTAAVPIVFAFAGDPVEAGLVASLSRPGGNVTGATNLNSEILTKRLELLHELVPAATSVALLVNPTVEDQTRRQLISVQTAARTMGLVLHVVYASAAHDLEPVFGNLATFRGRRTDNRL